MAHFVDEVLAGLEDGAQHLLRQLWREGLYFNAQQAGGFVVVCRHHALVVLEQVFALGVLVQPEEDVAALGGVLLDPVQALFEQQHHVHRHDVLAQVQGFFPGGRVGAGQQGGQAWYLGALVAAILADNHLGGADVAVGGEHAVVDSRQDHRHDHHANRQAPALVFTRTAHM
ncbi:hypothetical protein D3C77_401960 [compost metagenome]